MSVYQASRLIFIHFVKKWKDKNDDKSAENGLFVSVSGTNGLKINTIMKCVKIVSCPFNINEKTCRICVEKVKGSFYNERNFTFENRS